MAPKLTERNIGGGCVRHYFYRHRGAASDPASIFAIEESLPPSHKRSGEIEAMACWVREPVEDSHVGLIATDAAEVDPVSVARIKRLVGELEPDWVEAIRKATLQTNALEEIAAASGVSELNAVAAVVAALVEAGEVPPLEIEGPDDG